MARIYPLFSSSSGNSHFIGTPDGGILIDAGVSCRRLVAALRLNGIQPEAVRAVFITHDHTDHIGGLKTFESCFGAPVYASRVTLRKLLGKELLPPECKCGESDGGVEAGGFYVTSYKTPHDAEGSVGYKIHTPAKTPPAPVLIKKACGIESGSGVPNKTKVATLSKADLQKIAETKMPDLNAASLEAAMSMIAGTARSMGVLVEK